MIWHRGLVVYWRHAAMANAIHPVAGIACPRSNLIGNDAYIPQFPDPVRQDFIRE